MPILRPVHTRPSQHVANAWRPPLLRTSCITRVPCMQRGYTLVELMVVLAVVAILGALAYPTYTQYLARRDRLEAIQGLYEAQQFMARYYAANSRYSADTQGQTPATLPTRLQSTPVGGTARWRISVQASTSSANSYTLLAEPVALRSDATLCEQVSLSLAHTGAKTATLEGVSLSDTQQASCWR